MEKDEMFQNLCEIAKMIAQTFGEHCETVIHDCDDYERFIARIYNGHVSGRKEGDHVNVAGMPVSRDHFRELDPVTSYAGCEVVTTGGRTLKSSTAYFKGKDYHYGLGINFDITQYTGMRDALDRLISTSTNLEEEISSRQSLNSLVNDVLSGAGLPVDKMSKSDRLKVIGMLHERGVFQRQKAIPYVAERLKISRYSVYNYLKELGLSDQGDFT